MNTEQVSYSPRVRTGLLRLKGGLKYNEQCVRIGVKLPERRDDNVLRSKVFISSGMFGMDDDGKLNEKPKEYLSLIMGDMMEIKSFSVSFFLAVREYAKYEGMNLNYVHSELSKRLDTCFQTQHFDEQLHTYGVRK